jgi:hypothetical protein
MDFQPLLSLRINDDPRATPAAAIFARNLTERGGVAVRMNHPEGYPIELVLDETIQGESFAIEDGPVGLRIRAGGGLGLI